PGDGVTAGGTAWADVNVAEPATTTASNAKPVRFIRISLVGMFDLCWTGANLGQSVLAEPIISQRESARASGRANPWHHARLAGSVPRSGATAAPPARDFQQFR